MGCAPSHNGIIQILAKNAAKPLTKNKSILTPEEDTNGITVPLASSKHPSCQNLNDETKRKTRSKESECEINYSEKGFSDASGGLSRSGSFSEDQRKHEAHGTADEGMVNLTYQKRRTTRKYSSTCSEQELSQDPQRDGNPRRGRKLKSRKSGKHRRNAKQGQIVFLETEKKVDFPELLVKAHQDAYAFLNPNLSKYEGVISMVNQATQTQLIMQQMTSFMTLRFDEINQCLGEIADDGEKLLKAVEGNLTWPCEKDNLSEHPDLLQQLLQYTVNRMQSLNCTVSSLTTNALQETCSFLQSAVNSFQEKLKKKEHHDKRLLKVIKALEDSAAGSTQPQPNDLTLYSEDSGIGDSESIRGYKSPEKMERKASTDISGHISLKQGEEIISKEGLTCGTNMVNSTADFNSGSDKVAEISQKQVDNPKVCRQISITSNISESSLGTCATLEQDSVQDPEDSSSSDDSYEESDDNKSLSSQVTLPQRPVTSPARTCSYKHLSKWIENPENEEMTLKMKEAISEKIKFVPGISSSDVWTREEVCLEVLRPSTADGSNRRTARHRRSRSAESLKSQSEDPTLLELQRTQKELTKKLEQLYLSNGTRSKETPQNCSSKSFVHAGCISASAAPTNKLKACLDKGFNILPSQEMFPVRKPKMNVPKDPNANHDNPLVSTKLPKEDEKIVDNPALAEQKLESIISPRQSVRKLIQAFSPEENLIKNLNRKTLGPLKCVRKVGVPVLPPTIPACKGLQVLDNNNDNLSKADRIYINASANLVTNICVTSSSASQDFNMTYTNEFGIEDPENLPPPPLEILMDDSFSLLPCDGPYHNSLPSAIKNAPTTSKIKTSINIKDLLPNKNSTETYMPTVRTSGKKEPVIELRKLSLQSGQHNREKDPVLDPMRKNEIEVAHLYKQSHKIIPLQNPGDADTLKSIPHIDSADQSTPLSLPKQKQCSPTLQRSEKSQVTLRRTSPTRATACSPPTERKISNPPTGRAIVKTRSQAQPSPPPVQKGSSPSCSFRVPSPPNQSKLSSPPTLCKLTSPPNQSKLSSPPTLRKLPSPPQIRRQQSPPSHQSLPSPPQIRRQQSPPSHQRLPSPPQIRRQQSPPSHQRMPSPAQIRRQQSPPSQHRLPSPPQSQKQQSSPPLTRKKQSPPSQRRAFSPPSSRREHSPPAHFTPSPPLSPSFTHRGLRRNSDEPQASPKMIGNAQSIFCPSSTSLFEAKPASPPCINNLGESAPNQASVSVLKHSLSGRQYDDQHRRLATSAANPQPFVRRCYSDRRPRVQLRLPTSASTSVLSEPALHQIG
uniref:Photoreceptor cilium actin regulator n=2 Tax=Pyxicephalus adspersus TaxID=30357 RepID=A0AAV3ATB9_PYXAD|nr:TPA: hypothetical protein GDO54_011506 [Pyxicephalus adspersus]